MPIARSLPTALLAAAAATASALALTACGGGEDRSPEAYCRAFYEKAAPIRQGYVDASKNVNADPLTSIVKLLQAPSDMAAIFGGMVDHAPDDIKSDTEQVRDSFKKLSDSEGDMLSNPLLAAGKSIINGVAAGGSFERVDAYLAAHCPVSSKLAQDIINGKS
jgi:hypothetical protein